METAQGLLGGLRAQMSLARLMPVTAEMRKAFIILDDKLNGEVTGCSDPLYRCAATGRHRS